MKKMLYILNIANRVNNFSYASMVAAKELNIEFHIAGNWGYKNQDELKKDEEKYGIKIYQVDFKRNPLHPGNIKAFWQLKKIFKQNSFNAVHCNTPVGGLLGRICAKKYKIKQIIYQAHGFHFYKGAPFLNWAVYYPIERLMANTTNYLITINKEDYERAKKFKLKTGGKVFYVPGVGIDTQEFTTNSSLINKKRLEFNLNNNDIALLSVGELNNNKNYSVVIKALKECNNSNIHYFLCGVGNDADNLKKLAEQNNIANNVHFLGYRKDIKELYSMADCYVISSFREGLSRSLMEAMACGLPCIASDIRGNCDLIQNGQGGFLIDPTNYKAFAEKITFLINNKTKAQQMGAKNIKNIKNFSVEEVTKNLKQIYMVI